VIDIVACSDIPFGLVVDIAACSDSLILLVVDVTACSHILFCGWWVLLPTAANPTINKKYLRTSGVSD